MAYLPVPGLALRTHVSIQLTANATIQNRSYEEFVDIALVQCGFQILPVLPTHTASDCPGGAIP
jgi:hypothetical protein